MINKIYSIVKLENKPEIVIFSILITYCLFYILLHGLYVIGIDIPSSQFSKDLYRVTFDHSYGEFFQYQLLLGCCIIIVLLSYYRLKYIFLFPLFLLLLLDDYLLLHENYSKILFKNFELNFSIVANIIGIRVNDIFEISWHFITLTMFIFSLSILLFKKEEILLVLLKKYIFAVFLLIFFALFVDIVGVPILDYLNRPKHFINTAIYFIEEGGEMITCSYLFSIFFGHYLKAIS